MGVRKRAARVREVRPICFSFPLTAADRPPCQMPIRRVSAVPLRMLLLADVRPLLSQLCAPDEGPREAETAGERRGGGIVDLL